MTYLDDIITRVLAQCMEAVPAQAGFDFHGIDYPNFPYWTVGETEVETRRFGSELQIGLQITARLYGGKTTENNAGVIEKELRGCAAALIEYFAERLDLTSAAYPEPMDGIVETGVFLNPIRRRIVGQNPSFFVLELVFNIPVLL